MSFTLNLTISSSKIEMFIVWIGVVVGWSEFQYLKKKNDKHRVCKRLEIKNEKMFAKIGKNKNQKPNDKILIFFLFLIFFTFYIFR